VTFVIYSISVVAISFLLYSLLGGAYTKISLKAKELEDAKRQIEEKKTVLEQYQQELISLSRNENLLSISKDNLFEAICESASKSLKVSRVSVWMLEENNTCLVRKYLYESGNSSDEKVTLFRADFPNYFAALETKPFIIANEARKNADTSEFTESYLIPLGIYSMLDCPIVLNRKSIGVVCCEHKHVVKMWDIEDALFTQSLADIISTSYRNERIKHLLLEVRQKNFELVEKNNEIQTMNEELNALNEELNTLNESLEQTVRHRTRELETQNIQLTEYAFINSHLLRAPLARILGLSNLLTKEATSVKDAQLINALLNSTNELDQIIRKISDILYDGNNLSREDIRHIIEKKIRK
jgi:cell division protein FtsL